MPLLSVQSFLNTENLDLRTDALADVQSATEWFQQAQLIGPAAVLTQPELRTARAARAGIRALARQNTGGPQLTVSEMRELEAIADQSALRLRVSQQGVVGLTPWPGTRLADGLLRLLLIVRDEQEASTWARLKVCGNPDCGWAFYDRSHGRRGAWCEMASCGNIMKNRSLRSRRAATGRATDGGL
jgi:predicted RNA-binding Zn ribbon-like protein